MDTILRQLGISLIVIGYDSRPAVPDPSPAPPARPEVVRARRAVGRLHRARAASGRARRRVDAAPDEAAWAALAPRYERALAREQSAERRAVIALEGLGVVEGRGGARLGGSIYAIARGSDAERPALVVVDPGSVVALD